MMAWAFFVELSEALLLIEPKRRSRRAAKWLNDAQADI